MSFWAAATPVVVLTERALCRASAMKQGRPSALDNCHPAGVQGRSGDPTSGGILGQRSTRALRTLASGQSSPGITNE